MIITKKGVKENTIIIEESFIAPREKVFEAWSNTQSLKKWFMADEGVILKDVEIMLYVGGKFYINVMFPGYAPTAIKGEFIKVSKSKMLSYTWSSPILKDNITKVDVNFIDQSQGSKIQLSHGEFKNEEEMKIHMDGWKRCLKKLQKYLVNEHE